MVVNIASEKVDIAYFSMPPLDEIIDITWN